MVNLFFCFAKYNNKIVNKIWLFLNGFKKKMAFKILNAIFFMNK